MKCFSKCNLFQGQGVKEIPLKRLNVISDLTKAIFIPLCLVSAGNWGFFLLSCFPEVGIGSCVLFNITMAIVESGKHLYGIPITMLYLPCELGEILCPFIYLDIPMSTFYHHITSKNWYKAKKSFKTETKRLILSRGISLIMNMLL